jgi:IS1 family transposase
MYILTMNKLPRAKRIAIVSALIEGCGVRATARMVGVTKGAVLKLLADVGTVCADYQNRTLRNLTCQRIQCDEIWSFVYAKARAIRQDPSILERNLDAGDAWTWTAIDADTKLAVSWLVADRNLSSAIAFMKDVESRLANRVQLTTDSYRLYLTAVDKAFGIGVDYAQLHKVYASETSGRYSPAVCIACESKIVTGDPDPKHINTSYVERQNLTMRMGMRRFTRLTNGHSKKIENTVHAIALHFMHYNFVRIHETLRVTPAMAAGIDSQVWDVADIIGLLEQAEQSAA